MDNTVERLTKVRANTSLNKTWGDCNASPLYKLFGLCLFQGGHTWIDIKF
jgi:hypothetical protein